MKTRKTLRFKVTLAAAAALLAAAPAIRAQGAAVKVAVVDLDRLVGSSAPGQALQKQLTDFQTQAQAEGQALTDRANETRRLISEGGNSLSEDRLAELEKQLEDQTIAIRRFRDDKQREGQKIQEEGLRNIQALLLPVFERLRDQDGYQLILNASPGVVVMASEGVDITDLVVERFNAAVSAAAAAPAATDGE